MERPGGGGVEIAIAFVLRKSNAQLMVTLVGKLRYRRLTQQDRLSNCFCSLLEFYQTQTT